MLEMICSGAQTGADINALKAAKHCGIPTGGWLPLGFRTLDGPKPEYIQEYGMKEHTSYIYSARTGANVRDSDATLRFARNFSSAGEKCTLREIKRFRRPYLDIHVDNPLRKEDVIKWLKENNVKILNVAGNSEETSPGIGEFVFNYLVELFRSFNAN